MISGSTRWLTLIALLCCLTLPLMGQADRATIGGTIVDQTGAVLPGVEVSAVNVQTGNTFTSLSNDAGQYSMLKIPIGIYTLTFALPGFKTFEQTGYQVTTGQSATLDVILDVGEVTETVTISATAEMLNSTNSLVSTTMQSDVITDLPLSFEGGRSLENFAYATVAGVEGNNWTSYMAGGPAFSKEVLIDGISATAQIQGHIGESSPTMEAVQEFKVQTSGMSAEYGRTSGGVFNFALKSGTNAFHGSAFYYGRNEAFNANAWMNNWNASQCDDQACKDNFKTATDRQHLGGFSLGGPIHIPNFYDGLDRTFIFGAFEHYTRASYELGPLNRTVPVPEFLAGDFSALLTDEVVGQDALGRDVYAGQIYDPATLRQVGGQWVSDPFVGNMIPSERFSGISQRINEVYKKWYQPMIGGRLINNNARTLTNNPWFHQTQLTLKGDHSFSDTNKMGASLIWTQRPRVLADQGGIWSDLDDTGGPMSRARKQEVASRRIVLNDNWTIRPNLINTVSLAFNRFHNPSISSAIDGDWTNLLWDGKPIINQDGSKSSLNQGTFPQVSFGGWVNGVGTDQIGYGANGFYVGNTYIANDTADWIVGRHNLKMGIEFWHQEMNNPASADAVSYNFTPNHTSHPGTSYNNRIGFGFASFLLGDVESANRGVANDLYGRRNYISMFLNDDFKATSKLTLNFGLRWEQAQPLTEIRDRWSNFTGDVMNTDKNLPGALEFASADRRSFEGPRDWKGFSPRLGVAYRATDRLVLRGGYGIFMIPLGIQSWSALPYAGSSTVPHYFGSNNNNRQGQLPLFNWDEGYPDNFEGAPSEFRPNYLSWAAFAIDPETLKLGYTHQYNASVQWQFNTDTTIEFTFMGNRGKRIHSGSVRKNQTGTVAEYEAMDNPGAWVWDQGSAEAAGVEYFPGFSGYASWGLSEFPHVLNTWGPVYWISSPRGSSSYYSYQVHLTRRLASGIAADMSYAYAKAKGNVSTAFDEPWDVNGGIQDGFNLEEAADTVLGYDQAHIFKGYASYELPFGRGRTWLADSPGWVDAVLGGWMVTGIFRYNTGTAMGAGPNVWRPGWDMTSAIYADADPNVQVKKLWGGNKGYDPGNPTASGNLFFEGDQYFSNPEGWKLGTGKNRYDGHRGFGWSNEDIGLMKFWRFGEAASLQLRAEFLNIFNRHHMSNPSTSIASSDFGYVSSTTGRPRNVQVGLRLAW